MNIWLHPQLAKHRRGRFLATALDASAVSEGGSDGDLARLPDEGLMLMMGKDFQLLDVAAGDELLAWCRQAGHSLLLLPPYLAGELHPGLDWRIGLRDAAAEPTGVAVVDAVRGELSFDLHGRDGGFSTEAGHQWPDFSWNTRFWKQHSGSGVFAATCLPLWSISLLGEGAAVVDWLAGMHRLAGTPVAGLEPVAGSEVAEALQALDYGVMVCVFAWQESDSQRLKERLMEQPLPILDFGPERLIELAEKLRSGGFLGPAGLSGRGETALRESPYWGYAQSLREEVS